MFAVGDNEDLPAHGREPGPVKLAAYTISGLLSGLAGVVLAGRLGAGQPGRPWLGDGCHSRSRHGRNVSRRGAGSVFPTLAGVLLLGMMYNLLNLGDHYPPWWQLVLRGGFLLLVVIFQRIAQRRGW